MTKNEHEIRGEYKDRHNANVLHEPRTNAHLMAKNETVSPQRRFESNHLHSFYTRGSGNSTIIVNPIRLVRLKRINGNYGIQLTSCVHPDGEFSSYVSRISSSAQYVDADEPLFVGDCILAVGGFPCSGTVSSQVAQLILQSKGPFVTLKVKHDSNVQMLLTSVENPTVSSQRWVNTGSPSALYKKQAPIGGDQVLMTNRQHNHNNHIDEKSDERDDEHREQITHSPLARQPSTRRTLNHIGETKGHAHVGNARGNVESADGSVCSFSNQSLSNYQEHAKQEQILPRRQQLQQEGVYNKEVFILKEQQNHQQGYHQSADEKENHPVDMSHDLQTQTNRKEPENSKYRHKRTDLNFVTEQNYGDHRVESAATSKQGRPDEEEEATFSERFSHGTSGYHLTEKSQSKINDEQDMCLSDQHGSHNPSRTDLPRNVVGISRVEVTTSSCGDYDFQRSNAINSDHNELHAESHDSNDELSDIGNHLQTKSGPDGDNSLPCFNNSNYSKKASEQTDVHQMFQHQFKGHQTKSNKTDSLHLNVRGSMNLSNRGSEHSDVSDPAVSDDTSFTENQQHEQLSTHKLILQPESQDEKRPTSADNYIHVPTILMHGSSDTSFNDTISVEKTDMLAVNKDSSNVKNEESGKRDSWNGEHQLHTSSDFETGVHPIIQTDVVNTRKLDEDYDEDFDFGVESVNKSVSGPIQSTLGAKDRQESVSVKPTQLNTAMSTVSGQHHDSVITEIDLGGDDLSSDDERVLQTQISLSAPSKRTKQRSPIRDEKRRFSGLSQNSALNVHSSHNVGLDSHSLESSPSPDHCVKMLSLSPSALDGSNQPVNTTTGDHTTSQQLDVHLNRSRASLQPDIIQTTDRQVLKDVIDSSDSDFEIDMHSQPAVTSQRFPLVKGNQGTVIQETSIETESGLTTHTKQPHQLQQKQHMSLQQGSGDSEDEDTLSQSISSFNNDDGLQLSELMDNEDHQLLSLSGGVKVQEDYSYEPQIQTLDQGIISQQPAPNVASDANVSFSSLQQDQTVEKTGKEGDASEHLHLNIDHRREQNHQSSKAELPLIQQEKEQPNQQKEQHDNIDEVTLKQSSSSLKPLSWLRFTETGTREDGKRMENSKPDTSGEKREDDEISIPQSKRGFEIPEQQKSIRSIFRKRSRKQHVQPKSSRDHVTDDYMGKQNDGDHTNCQCTDEVDDSKSVHKGVQSVSEKNAVEGTLSCSDDENSAMKHGSALPQIAPVVVTHQHDTDAETDEQISDDDNAELTVTKPPHSVAFTHAEFGITIQALIQRLRDGDLRLTFLDLVYPQHCLEDVHDEIQTVILRASGRAVERPNLLRSVDIGVAGMALLFALHGFGRGLNLNQFVSSIVGPHPTFTEASLLSTLSTEDEHVMATSLQFLGEMANVVSQEAGTSRFDAQFAAQKKKKKSRFRFLRRQRKKKAILDLNDTNGNTGNTFMPFQRHHLDSKGHGDAGSDCGSTISFASTRGNAPALGDACNQIATVTAPLLLPIDETDIDIEQIDFAQQGDSLSQGLRVVSILEELLVDINNPCSDENETTDDEGENSTNTFGPSLSSQQQECVIDLLTHDSLALLHVIIGCSNESYSGLEDCLVTACTSRGAQMVYLLIDICIEWELCNTQGYMNMLNLSTRSLRILGALCRALGNNYLVSVLLPLISTVRANPDAFLFVVGGHVHSNNSKQRENERLVAMKMQEFLNRMYRDVSKVPPFLRYILYKLRVESNVAYSDVDQLAIRRFFFNVFLVPALCHPRNFHILGKLSTIKV